MSKADSGNTTYFIISHTHWDREWYLSFQRFRIKLVRLMDNLLELLAQEPTYRFHLDAQTIVIDDYLEIRPEKQDELQSYIKNGRILVGPWYVQNDLYLTSGEATIRNLQIGFDKAQSLGGCTRVGYVPDQFGLISQLPQILRGFSISDVLFGRGYTIRFGNPNAGDIDESRDIVFHWDSPDGSRVLAGHMAQWYNNAQRFSRDLDRSLKMLRRVRHGLAHRSPTGALLCMNGVDHLEAQEDLLPILDGLQEKLDPNEELHQSTMPEYFIRVRDDLDRKERGLQTWTGELRKGAEYDILTNTASSRVYLKQANQRLQDLLENYLEPLAATYLGLGLPQRYPHAEIVYAWKRLIQNHAHDSICGCSRDEVHRHMEDRFEEVDEVIDSVSQEISQDLSYRIDRSSARDGDFLITVFNTTNQERTEVVSVTVEIPQSAGWERFRVLSPEGEGICPVVVHQQLKERPLLSPVNLPGGLTVVSLSLQFSADRVPPFGHKTYQVGRVEVGDEGIALPESPSIEGTAPLPAARDVGRNGLCIETDVLSIGVDSEGRIRLTDSKSGQEWESVLTLVDEEDAGDAYVHRYGSIEQIHLDGYLRDHRIVRSDDLCTVAELTYDAPLPAFFDMNENRRSRNAVSHAIRLRLELRGGEPWVRCSVLFENRARDHRLRAVIRTGADTPNTLASAPFDLVERDVRAVQPEVRKGDHPFSGLVVHQSAAGGMAVLTKGLYEYEHVKQSPGEIAVTLMRGNSFIFKFNDKPEPPNDLWRVPENQCLRTISVDFALMPLAEPMGRTGLLKALQRYRNPLRAQFHPVDPYAFSGGRPGVQDTDIQEIFHRPLEHPDVQLPPKNSMLRVDGSVLVSAVKRSYAGTDLIVRVYSVEDRPVECTIHTRQTLVSAFLCDLRENEIGPLPCRDNHIALTVPPRGIRTVRLRS